MLWPSAENCGSVSMPALLEARRRLPPSALTV
jgi:hypothetical protein